MFNDDPGACPYGRKLLIALRTITAEVVRLVGEILPLVGLFQVFDANAAANGGILRARGKQVRPFPPAFVRAQLTWYQDH